MDHKFDSHPSSSDIIGSTWSVHLIHARKHWIRTQSMRIPNLVGILWCWLVFCFLLFPSFLSFLFSLFSSLFRFSCTIVFLFSRHSLSSFSVCFSVFSRFFFCLTEYCELYQLDYLSVLFLHTSTDCSHSFQCCHIGNGSSLKQKSHPRYRIATLFNQHTGGKTRDHAQGTTREHARNQHFMGWLHQGTNHAHPT